MCGTMTRFHKDVYGEDVPGKHLDHMNRTIKSALE